jgi:hypothetical protein
LEYDDLDRAERGCTEHEREPIEQYTEHDREQRDWNERYARLFEQHGRANRAEQREPD